MSYKRYIYVHPWDMIGNSGLGTFSPRSMSYHGDTVNVIQYLNKNAGEIVLADGFSGSWAVVNNKVKLHPDWYTYINEENFGEDGFNWYILMNEIRSAGFIDDVIATGGWVTDYTGIYLREEAHKNVGFRELIAQVKSDGFEMLKDIDDYERMCKLLSAITRYKNRKKDGLSDYDIPTYYFKTKSSDIIGDLVLVEKKGVKWSPQFATMEEFKKLNPKHYHFKFQRGYVVKAAKKLGINKIEPFNIKDEVVE